MCAWVSLASRVRRSTSRRGRTTGAGQADRRSARPGTRWRCCRPCVARCKAIDPTLPVVEPRTLRDVQSMGLTDRRLPMQLMAAFALLALVLAAVGVYGVMAYSVAARTREIGVRVALGAQPSNVFGMIVRQGTRLGGRRAHDRAAGRCRVRAGADEAALRCEADRCADVHRCRRGVARGHARGVPRAGVAGGSRRSAGGTAERVASACRAVSPAGDRAASRPEPRPRRRRRSAVPAQGQ